MAGVVILRKRHLHISRKETTANMKQRRAEFDCKRHKKHTAQTSGCRYPQHIVCRLPRSGKQMLISPARRD